MLFQVSTRKNIEIDEEVVEYIQGMDRDFRVCTTCYGSEVLPVTMKRPKPSDLTVRIGDNTLYISIIQANYISRVEKNMLRPDYIAAMERFYLKS